MPKSKSGPSLFELYNKRQGDKTSEERVTSKRSPIGESASAFRATLANLARTINRDQPSPQSEKSPNKTSAGSSVGIDRGCLHVSLTSRMSGVLLALLLVCVIGVFSMGQWVGHKYGLADGRKQARLSIQGGVDNDIATARESQPVENLFAGIGPSPVTSPAKAKTQKRGSAAQRRDAGRTQRRSPKSSTGSAKKPVSLIAKQPKSHASRQAKSRVTWVKGLTYVVVQSFRSDAAKDAEKARAFLAKQGVDSEIVARANRPIWLIATQGFNRKNKTQRDLADRFLKRIRTIGKAYSKAGGRYKLEGYLATLKKESW
ncbi:MAG: hypothetical protein GXP29_10940 [Planctomycetes bacterium]|nr:hypothetical protein [Planctomycetota bacterium]